MLVKSVKKPRNLISLFCGCGGFDLGFISHGFNPIGAFDSNLVAVHHYKQNVHCDAAQLDLTNCSLDAFRNRNVGVLIAGPPCQGFSTVGNRNLDDHRNALLPLTAELAIRIRPKIIVVENVAGARSGEHVRYWNTLDGRLRSNGFRTHTLKANAASVGMAQRRQRLFLFAWSTGREIEFKWPNLEPGRLDHILAGVESRPNHNPKMLYPDSRLFKISQRIGPGQKLSNVRGGERSVHTWHIPEVFGYTTAAECEVLETIMRIRRAERRRDFGDADPVPQTRLKMEFGAKTDRLLKSLIRKGFLRIINGNFDLVHTFNGKCRRFRWDDIACAVDTRFGDPNLFLHPNEHRPFTVREAARIQGFPDSFRFDNSESENFKMIGNAVPPTMAEAAADLADHLLVP